MDNLVDTLTDPQFLIAVLAADLGRGRRLHLRRQLHRRHQRCKERIKRVALEREKMRAEEMARLRGGGGGTEQPRHPPRPPAPATT